MLVIVRLRRKRSNRNSDFGGFIITDVNRKTEPLSLSRLKKADSGKKTSDVQVCFSRVFLSKHFLFK